MAETKPKTIKAKVKSGIGEFVGNWGSGNDRRSFKFKAGVIHDVPEAAFKAWCKYLDKA